MAKIAYDYKCSLIEKTTGVRPEKPFKGKGCRLSPETVLQIREMLKAGRSPCEIYRPLGCSRASVYSEMKRLESESL